MGTKERREREKENLRQEILDAARQLFLRNGYENVSMRQIAKKIEYSPTTIYLYFKNKSELFHSLCEEAFTKLEKELSGIVRIDGDSVHFPAKGVEASIDPVWCLRKGADAYIRFGLHYPHHYRLLFLTPHPDPEDKDPEFQFKGSAGERSFRYLLEIVSLGVEQGKFRKSDPMMLAQACWAVMHGITALLITEMDFPWVDKDALIEGVVETLVRGVAA
jgi:AcrR family transcriptional regulator